MRDSFDFLDWSFSWGCPPLPSSLSPMPLSLPHPLPHASQPSPFSPPCHQLLVMTWNRANSGHICLFSLFFFSVSLAGCLCLSFVLWQCSLTLVHFFTVSCSPSCTCLWLPLLFSLPSASCGVILRCFSRFWGKGLDCWFEVVFFFFSSTFYFLLKCLYLF